MSNRRPRTNRAVSSKLRLTTLEDRVTPTALPPDLFAHQANLSGWTVNTLTGGGREIRFATAMANGGTGAFELRGTTTYVTGVDGVQRQLVNQRVYQSDGTFEDRQAGYFVYHPGHGHIHFEDMAFATVRQRLPGNGLGDVVALGPKTSFALIDIQHWNPNLPGSPANAVYGGGNVQGISVGWNDVYGSGLEGQSVNITGVANGDYWLEVTVDPLNHILETNETNNTTRIPITLSNLPPSGFRIYQATPIGAQIAPVSYAELNFSQSVDPNTFTTSDVTFSRGTTNIPITGITQVTSTQFRVNFATQGAIGTYTMNIGPDIRTTTGQLLDTNNNGVGGEQADTFSLIFTETAPRFVNTTPAPGAVTPPFNTVRVNFSRPMQSATFTTADIATFAGPGGVNLVGAITGIVPATPGGLSTSFDINFADQTANGPYNLVIEPTILDEQGNPVDNNGDGQSNQADRFSATYTISPVGVAGPDAFGYTGVTTPVTNLELVGQANTVPITFTSTDDGSTAFNLGTNVFNFYGTTYTGNNRLYVSTNGLLSFGSALTAFSNSDMTDLTLPVIAPLWDDWIIGSGTPQALGKFFDDNADGVSDRLVIEWNQVYHFSSSPQGGTFQVQLQLNTGNTPGKILFNYPDLIFGDANDGGASATVGMRSPAGTILLISQNGSNNLVGNNKAINVSVPTVQSMSRLDPNPAPTGDLEYLVTFSSPVTGVDVNDFAVTATGGSVGTYVDHIHTTADPAVYEVHLRTTYASGTVRLDLVDNGSIVSSLGAQLGGTGNGNGNFNGPVYNVVQPAPSIQGINVGDGTQQRSQLKLIQVIFDYPVQFQGGNGNAAAAFELIGPNGPVTISVDLSLSTPNQTVARLTFSGANTEFGSIKDGVYNLRVIGSMISTGGVLLDGDGNGTPGGDRTLQIHRLFGDVNGDGTVNSFDYSQFGRAFGSSLGDPNYRDYLDFDGDGVINGTINGFDFGQLRGRFGVNLFP